MQYAEPLTQGRLLRRYKRFLADVELPNGETITAHTANPGAMTGLTRPGSAVFLSYHDKPSRKLKYTWELVRVGRCLVGVNPVLANRLVSEAIARGRIAELRGYPRLRREVPLGESRIDLLLEHDERPACYVEVKSVTLVKEKVGRFPDAPSARGRRHLRELAAAVAAGHRAVLCFVLPRRDADAVGPADAVDPAYGETLREVAAEGVELIAYRARVRRRGIVLAESVPVVLD